MLNWNQAANLQEAEEAEREQRLVEEALAKREAEEARKAAEEQEQERRKAEEVPPLLGRGRWLGKDKGRVTPQEGWGCVCFFLFGGGVGGAMMRI